VAALKGEKLMSDYLEAATDILKAPAPLREMLARDRAGTIDALIKCLGSPNIMVRKYAAFSLGQIGETGVIEVLRSVYGSEQAGGAKDAMGAAIIALLEVPSGATDHIRAAAVDNVYHGRPWDAGLQEALAANRVPLPTAYLDRIGKEIASAPDSFKAAFFLLSQGRLAEASRDFCGCLILGGDGMTDEWAGTAACCSAYCEAEQDNYEDALLQVEPAKLFGFHECGGFYYYSAIFKALNQLDRLQEALSIAEEAIQYFSKREAPGDVAAHLGGKANVLKQMASHLSRSQEPNRARPVIIAAINAYCDSLSITTTGFGDSDAEELDGMSRIATRVGVSRRDLTFLNSMPSVERVVSRFLPK
jgi:tetratricopeptide (TPR) repeat protein